MNPIGANTWIWVSPLTDERLASIAPRVRAFGFDVIELPIENLGDWDPARARDLLHQHHLGATTCAVMSPDRDLVSGGPEVSTAWRFGEVDLAGAGSEEKRAGGWGFSAPRAKGPMSKKATWTSPSRSLKPSHRNGERNCGSAATGEPAGGRSIRFQAASARAWRAAQKAM